MESVPTPMQEYGEKYLDDNAERFEPNPLATPSLAPDEFRVRIERLGRELGFVRIGFASAEPFLEAGRRFKDWLGQGHAGTMNYLAEFGDRHRPGRLLANARSVIVAAAAMPSPSSAASEQARAGKSLSGKVADYALGLDYHIALRSRLRAIGQGLADGSGQAIWTRPCIDTAPLLEREAARLAGIGFIAKSTMLIVPGVGPRVMLAALVTDLELRPGEPQESRCGRCTACLDACPTNAFVAPFRLDARRCLSYLSIERPDSIPEQHREAMGNRIFGCDVCQAVCPYDRADQAEVMPSDASPRLRLIEPDLVSWLEMTATDYRRITKRSALRRVGRVQLMRNAAIGLGNSGSPAAIAPLIRALESNRSSLVRAHVAWALSRLGGSQARDAIARVLTQEEDAEARAELDAALNRLDADAQFTAGARRLDMASNGPSGLVS